MSSLNTVTLVGHLGCKPELRYTPTQAAYALLSLATNETSFAKGQKPQERTEWHRVEVFNSIRQLVLHPDAKRRLVLAEAKALIHRLESDVRLGYFTHLEADWRDVFRTANEVSVEHSFVLPCRAPDLLHVAYANELAAEIFVSFDDDQLDMARASGLKALRPS